ncbi:calcium ion binding [Branchiostoma belcheri]|nr:calcium ion binding [Branchiostoma belcheri]
MAGLGACLLTTLISVLSLTAAEEAYLVSLHGWHYYKVRASGTMTSANIKHTCEAAGYIMPCPSEPCSSTSSTCVNTGLVASCYFPMDDISQVLCGDYATRCPAMEGIFAYYSTNRGEAIGVQPITRPGDWLHGRDYSNQFALCAKVDYCASDPCHNGGTCVDGVNSYTCQCVPGLTGDNCENDIDECSSDPCQYGGTCVDGVNSYTCQCVPGFTGDNCENVLNADKCFQLSEEPKAHQAAEGQCATLGGTLAGVKTVAEQEFLADQVRLGTDVSHWVGLKNGQEHFLYTDLSTMSSNLRWMSGKPEHLCALLDKNGNYDLNADFCTEQYNYVCESYVVTCKQNVCLNGGNCTSCFNGTYAYCDCAPGFVGDRCEIGYGRADADLYRCESFSCPYGWSCQDRGQLSFVCGEHV